MVEQGIIESERKYRSLFEQASDYIMITDFEGNFIDVNESMCKKFGYTRAELLSMNISSLIDKDQLKNEPIRFNLLAEGQHVFNKRDMVLKNGNIIHVEANVKKFGDGMVMAIARDVTELNNVKRQIEISESTFRTAFENSAIGMAIVSLRGRWLRTNHALCAMLGYTQDELIDMTFKDVSHPDDVEEGLDFLRRSLNGEMDAYRTEKRCIHKDGTIVWGSLNVSLTRDKEGKPVFFISQIEDITKRKRTEEEKEKIRHMLKERIKELTTSYRFSRILQSEYESITEMMQELVTVLPLGWQYPEITAARIVLGEVEFKTLGFAPRTQSQSARFKTPDGIEAMIEVVYLEEKPEEQEGPFLTEERNLINLLSEMFRTHLSRIEESETLKKSEANLHTILDTTDNAYILLDKNHNIVTYNKGAANFATNELKITEEIGKQIEHYFLRDRRDKLNDLMKSVMEGKSAGYETTYPQDDGSFHYYNVRLFPITNQGKEVMGIMIELNNITVRRVYEEKISRQLELFREISFINSHELRHEYAKLHSLVDYLKDKENLNSGENRMLIEESLKTFKNINSSIFKINDKLTFGQYTKIHESNESSFKVEKMLLVDDDPVTNFINERKIGKHFEKRNIHTAYSADTALEHLRYNDDVGNYLILLDLTMPIKDGWDFLDEYSLFEIQSPVVILSSSINQEDVERAKQYPMVKNFISKPLADEVAKKIKSLI